MLLKKGDKAPQFELFTSDKTEFNSEELKGKIVVLLFYPMAFSSVCTQELSYFRDLPKEVENQMEIVGISVDSVFTLNRFKEEFEFNFPLLSDFNKEVCRSYGALYENWIFDMKGVSKRAAFVIGKKGTIQYTEVLENANNELNYPAIIEQVKKLST